MALPHDYVTLDIANEDSEISFDRPRTPFGRFNNAFPDVSAEFSHCSAIHNPAADRRSPAEALKQQHQHTNNCELIGQQRRVRDPDARSAFQFHRNERSRNDTSQNGWTNARHFTEDSVNDHDARQISADHNNTRDRDRNLTHERHSNARYFTEHSAEERDAQQISAGHDDTQRYDGN